MCFRAPGNNQVERRSDTAGQGRRVSGMETLVAEKAWDSPQER